MKITLNEEESAQYIEFLDKMKIVADIKEFIKTLTHMKQAITPPVFLFHTGETACLSWEKARQIIEAEAEKLTSLLDKLINKYSTERKEQK